MLVYKGLNNSWVDVDFVAPVKEETEAGASAVTPSASKEGQDAVPKVRGQPRRVSINMLE